MPSQGASRQGGNHRALAWFVDNPIAANLLMLIFIAGGALSLLRMHKEEFPNIEPGVVQVLVPYLGAAPEEVEEAVCIRIEEALEGMEGVERLTSVAREGACSVLVELLPDASIASALNDVKSKVDAIATFPAETEKPQISSLQFLGDTISIAISGRLGEAALKLIAEEIRDDISAMEGISQVSVNYARPWEISIEVSENTLRQYRLTMTDIADAIRRSSLDLPGGSIRTQGGEVLLRAKGQAYRGADYEGIIVLTQPDGAKVTLGDLAVVRDGFEEGYLRAQFDGERAVIVTVYRVGDEDTITGAEAVKRYLERKKPYLPKGVALTIWIDESEELERRIGALTRNAYTGLALVLLTLTLFLRFKVAIWVAAGIPIAVLGAIWAFPAVGLSISSLTVLAFILVLGIVVDDAIVVGERIFSHEARAGSHRQAAIRGTAEVLVPVVFGVLTTIAAFLPILLVEGNMGQFFSIIGWVVLICLVFSILECMFILPAHLAHRRTRGYFLHGTLLVAGWIRFQGGIARGLERFARGVYRPFLVATLEWRWVTWALATGVLVTALALIASGRVIFQFFPSIEGNRIYASLAMPEGINVEATQAAAGQLEAAARATARELDLALGRGPGESAVQHVFSSIGIKAARATGPPSITSGGSHLAEVVLDLVDIKERPGWNANRIADLWRQKAGPITDAVELQFTASAFSAGDAIALQVKGRDLEELRRATQHLRDELARYPGVLDLTDSFRSGKQEVKLDILPEARPLGLTLRDLARQVRQAFYGEEVQRIQRGTDDVRVMVRYPEAERRSLSNLENMRIRTPDASEVPFSSVAAVQYGIGYASIRREDQQRVIDVTGDVDRTQVTPEEILGAVQEAVCEPGTAFSGRGPKCVNRLFPGVTFKVSGEQEQRNRALGSMAATVPIALMIIFALLAIPLKSYAQPLIIMSVIPFGAVGAIVGHYIMGWDLIFFSLLGIIALSGVVVNASLVMVDFINRQRRAGMPLFDAVTLAGVVRFRPILLTSVTTFVGLIPLMTNTDPATFMFIPMAISLAFGVLFATVITLFLVPSLYLMLEDLLGLLGMGEGAGPRLAAQGLSARRPLPQPRAQAPGRR